MPKQNTARFPAPVPGVVGHPSGRGFPHSSSFISPCGAALGVEPHHRDDWLRLRVTPYPKSYETVRQGRGAEIGPLCINQLHSFFIRSYGFLGRSVLRYLCFPPLEGAFRVHLVHSCLGLNPKPIISRSAAGRQPISNRYQWRLFSAIVAYYRLLSPFTEFFQFESIRHSSPVTCSVAVSNQFLA
jgi:hypothetical protein